MVPGNPTIGASGKVQAGSNICWFF